MSATHRDQVQEQTLVETGHALLIACGRFAEQVGLLEGLEQMPFRMKTLEHSPGAKAAGLLAHILAGGIGQPTSSEERRPSGRASALRL